MKCHYRRLGNPIRRYTSRPHTVRETNRMRYLNAYGFKEETCTGDQSFFILV